MSKVDRQPAVFDTSTLDKLALVKVVWEDASSLEHGWTDPDEEKPKKQLVTTVGFLVAATTDHVVVAHTTDGTWVNGRFQIPRGMVRKLQPLVRQAKAKQKMPSQAQSDTRNV